MEKDGVVPSLVMKGGAPFSGDRGVAALAFEVLGGGGSDVGAAMRGPGDLVLDVPSGRKGAHGEGDREEVRYAGASAHRARFVPSFG
jgi:hypothetical protein